MQFKVILATFLLAASGSYAQSFLSKFSKKQPTQTNSDSYTQYKVNSQAGSSYYQNANTQSGANSQAANAYSLGRYSGRLYEY